MNVKSVPFDVPHTPPAPFFSVWLRMLSAVSEARIWCSSSVGGQETALRGMEWSDRTNSKDSVLGPWHSIA